MSTDTIIVQESKGFDWSILILLGGSAAFAYWIYTLYQTYKNAGGQLSFIAWLQAMMPKA